MSSSAAAPWEPLLNRFLALIGPTSEPAPLWLDVWQLLLEDDWCRSELRRHAQSVLRVPASRRDQLDDLEQDAIIVLAQSLKQTPDLHADRSRLADSFPAWLGTILLNCCRMALRVAYEDEQTSPLTDEPVDPSPPPDMDEARLALVKLIDELEEPQHSVLLLASEGYSRRQIAELLGRPYDQVRKSWKRGVEQLKRRLRRSD